MSTEVIGGGCSTPDSPSDEKMDTCDSLNSQQPSSQMSSPLTDCDERADNRIQEESDDKDSEVLRIANPSTGDDNAVVDRMDNAGVLRLAEPKTSSEPSESTDYLTTSSTGVVATTNHSLTGGVDHDNNRSDDPSRVGRSRVPSSLTLTSDHPLMGLSSPDSPDKKSVNRDGNGVAQPAAAAARPVNSSSLKVDVRTRNPYQRAMENCFPSDISLIHSPSMSQSRDSLLLDNTWTCGTVVDELSPYQSDVSQINGSSATSLHDKGRRRIVPLSVPDATDDRSPCSSPDEDNSLYQASVDPFSGRAAMRPNHRTPETKSHRRKIMFNMPETPTETESSTDIRAIDSASPVSGRSENIYMTTVTHYVNGIQEGLSAGDCNKESNDDDCTDSDTENSRRDSATRSDASEPIPEYSVSEERQDVRDWVKVTLPGGGRRNIDMKVIEPYKRVLSHGGYTRSVDRSVSPGAAIILFSACYLPDSARVDYNYVMENLFLYVIWTLERQVTDEYVLVYLHGSAPRGRMPTFHWLKKCYHLIDRRLRKSLKHLYLVHPTFWLKSIVWMSRPFISTKFSQKLSYINTLEELVQKIPVEPAAIPEKVRQYDDAR